MENQSFQPDSYIDSEEKARVGANKENDIRNLSNGIDITDTEKESLIKIAEKQAEKAMQEYDAEKEKNPVEKLINRLNEIVKKMKEMGLEEDSEIVAKIQNRINPYIETLKKSQEEAENKLNRRITVDDLLKNDPLLRNFIQIARGIPVTHKIGNSGGWMYLSSGRKNTWFSSIDTISEENKDLYEKNGNEIINFSFSRKGATEFCKYMGILKDNEEFVDIPTIYENLSKSRINPLNYEAQLPTNIDGISLDIKYDSRRSYDGLTEQSIFMKFSDEFIKQLLA